MANDELVRALASPQPGHEQELIDAAKRARFLQHMLTGTSALGGGMSLAGLLTMNPGLLAAGAVGGGIAGAGVPGARRQREAVDSELEAYATRDRR